MALPKLTVPHYDVVCPSGQKVTFRPFLVKEEKLLMIAMQSDDTATILNSAKQVLENCVEAVCGVDIDKLALFDVEFLFLQLRARSIAEIIPLKYKCNQQVVEAETGNTVTCKAESEYPVNLLEITPIFAPGHNKHIQLTETVGLTLRYPTFKSFRNISRKDLPANEAFEFVAGCVESIHDAETVVFTKDVSVSEVTEFLDDMTKQQMEKVEMFFETMPKIEKSLNFKCPKCHYEEVILVKGLDNFFG